VRWPGKDLLVKTLYKTGFSTGLIKVEHSRERIVAMAGDGILVVASTAMGDAILCTPLLRVLRHQFPTARLGLLVLKPFANLFEKHGHGVKVHVYHGKYRDTPSVEKGMKDLYPVSLLANMNDPDVIPLLYRCGVKGFLRRPMRNTIYRAWMANQDQMRASYQTDHGSGHDIRQKLALAEWLGAGITEKDYQTEIFVSDNDEERAIGLVGQKKMIVLHPGASKDFKRWPIEYFIQLISKLGSSYSYLITGSSGDSGLADAICKGASGVEIQSICGKVTLREMAAVLKKSLLMISGDTGAYHLAMAMGCPTVTWFAPHNVGSDVEAVGPAFNHHKHLSLRPERVGDPISQITPEQVYEKAVTLLESPRNFLKV